MLGISPTSVQPVLLEKRTRLPGASEAIHYQFINFIKNAAFPCVLGRAAIVNKRYRFGVYQDMKSPDCAEGLCHDLWNFVDERPSAFPVEEGEYATFAAIFTAPKTTTEDDFEQLLWSLLQQMNENDANFHKWDTATNSDPTHAKFSFSFASCSFFVVGLHNQSSRRSRNFPYPVIVFNAHDQFDHLRKMGNFDKMQTAIRKRDIVLQGQINPSLKDYGNDSEAKQYSGRLVEPTWACPFKAQNK
jgi:uncharacterized protein